MRQSHYDNLYGRWVSSHTHALKYLAPLVPFTLFELRFAELWSAKQKEFGLRVGIHRDDDDRPIVMEVFGPDDMIPDRIIYSNQDGVQSDEFTGESEIYSSLEAALLEVASLY